MRKGLPPPRGRRRTRPRGSGPGPASRPAPRGRGRPGSLPATGALLLALLALPAAARAQGIDLSRGGPINVTARDGMDWNQNAQEVIARGDAKAIRGEVTVTADELVAHYRKKAAAPGAAPPAPSPKPSGTSAGVPGGDDTGANEIYRLEAIGHVHIFTPTDQAWGDHAIYDIDQAVLLLTGEHLKLVTPTDVLTARDAMEYWSAKHMSVGRGDAVVTTNDGRRVQADVLVGYSDPDPSAPAQPRPPVQQAAAKPGADPLTSGGKLKRVDAFGHVKVQTATEIVTGDRGVYVPDTGIARIVGNVHITRGENQLNGQAAIVNMRTGIATLSEIPGNRVEGLIVPNSDSGPAAQPAPGAAPPGARPARTRPGRPS